MQHGRSQSQYEALHEHATLWIMRRGPHTARCVLFRLDDVWQLRVFMDGTSLLIERCAADTEASALADRWRSRLQDRAWQQMLPAARNDGARSQAS